MGWTVYNSDGQILQGSSTLADDAVTTAKILDANVTLAKMANNSVDSDQYVDGSIDTVHIDALQITGAKIAANTITGDKIALGSDAQGDVMYYNGTDWVRLGFGTSGHFLKTQGTGANPVWAAAGSQSFTGDTTITSGNLVIATAGKGIDFSAQADEATGETMTAELLDHYEEGTFTPSLTFDTPGDLSVVYSARSGWYTRVGRLVTVTLVCITTTWTHSSASGFLKIADLPFTCIAAIEPIGVVMTQGVTGPSNRTQTSLYMPSSTNYMKVYWSGSAQGLSQTYPGNAPSGTAQSYYCTISYMV